MARPARKARGHQQAGRPGRRWPFLGPPQFRFPAENRMAFLLTYFFFKSWLSNFNLQPSSDCICPGPENASWGTNTPPLSWVLAPNAPDEPGATAHPGHAH